MERITSRHQWVDQAEFAHERSRPQATELAKFGDEIGPQRIKKAGMATWKLDLDLSRFQPWDKQHGVYFSVRVRVCA